MTVSSWKSVALATLLGPAASSGQRVQVLFVPGSSSSLSAQPVNMDPFLFGSASAAEPPCRRQRLEPWRRRVREQCSAEVEARCAAPEPELLAQSEPEEMEARDLRRQEWISPGEEVQLPAGISAMTSLEREMTSFFDELFLPPSQQRSPPLLAAGVDRQEDPFDRIVSDMLDFSLRAFDQAMRGVDLSMSPPREGVPPSEDEEDESSGWSEDVVHVPSNYRDSESSEDEVAEAETGQEFVGEPKSSNVEVNPSDESVEDMLIDEAYFEGDDVAATEESEVSADASPMIPEQAAENILDIMVASLARSAASSSADEAEEDGKVDLGWEEVGLPSIENMPELLFEIGRNLLAETSARRRLSEGEADPRLGAEERLARRLTEYRSNLVFSTEGDTITLYSPSYFPAPSLLASPFVGGAISPFPPSIPPALGMGSDRVDGCLRSHFAARDLEGTACHTAVGELLLAVDRGSPESPYFREFAAAPPAAAEEIHILAWVPSLQSQEGQGPGVEFLALTILSAVGLLCFTCFGCCDDEGEDDEEEEEEMGGEFDYVGMPEDGVLEVHHIHVSNPSQGFSEANGERVFVGVPVQVV